MAGVVELPLFLKEDVENELKMPSYIPHTLMTLIFSLIFVYGKFSRQAFGLCYTATTLDFQTFLYTCFDTCVVLLYSSSVRCGRRSIKLVLIAMNEVNPLYAYRILALKNIL